MPYGAPDVEPFSTARGDAWVMGGTEGVGLREKKAVKKRGGARQAGKEEMELGRLEKKGWDWHAG